MAEEKVDVTEWKTCEKCTVDPKCQDNYHCFAIRSEAEAMLVEARKMEDANRNGWTLEKQEKGRLQAKMAAAEARATAFFDEGVKKAAVIADREAAIKAFEKENAKERAHSRELENRLWRGKPDGIHTTSTPTPKRSH